VGHNETLSSMMVSRTALVMRMVENSRWTSVSLRRAVRSSDRAIERLSALPYRVDKLAFIVPKHHRYADRTSLRFEEALDEDFDGMQDGASIHTLCQQAAVIEVIADGNACP
jgi:hypothetical protein